MKNTKKVTSKVQKSERKRTLIQLLATAFSNGYIIGFFKHTIFTGKSKMFCVPGLNCYSCPAATGACPIGAMQAVLGSRKYSFSYYTFGIIAFIGVMFGRIVCGFLCPFGLLQDLLYKIPVPKIHVAKKIDKPMRWLKYVIALVFVILLPIFVVNKFGIGDPFFCKYICPQGILEGGIPLVSTISSLRENLGFLFNWKMGILVLVLVSSMFVYRPFCKYLCPLGAFYALFNKVSFFQMHVDMSKCIHCGKCEKTCDMNVEVLKNINSMECIRCGKCKSVCPTGAITSGFKNAGIKLNTGVKFHEIKKNERS